MKLLREKVRKFFFPPSGSPLRILLLPYLSLILMGVLLFGGGVQVWEYSNSAQFCGSGCHTMQPESTVYKYSPHSNITCEECHIGRAGFFTTVTRKSRGLLELYSETFKTYEYPLHAEALRPSTDTCEKCHRPETFSDDSLRTINHFGNTLSNPKITTYLLMKTGGGSKREGLGKGIHWHVENPVYYYSTDPQNQQIPYIRVMNEDGTYTEYVDVESGFNVANLDERALKPMDCITCHNRITHNFKDPAASVDESMARGAISPQIPGIHHRAVDVLSASYENHGLAMQAIDAIEEYYQSTS